MNNEGIFDLISRAGPVVQLVMVLLLLGSIACWAIIIVKLRQIYAANRDSEAFLNIFWNSDHIEDVYKQAEKYGESPLSEVFRSGYVELIKGTEALKKTGSKNSSRDESAAMDSIDRAMRRAHRSQITVLSSTVPFLATTGSAAPFIGLFGTVWGIMNSFRALIGSSATTTIQAVAPGIAEALIATAMGLLAAIPAVIFYNLLVNRIKILAAEMDNFAGDFLNIVDRHYL